MAVAGSEIGQKMRSAIKAKLTELGCYVDDELPDYVMVMVANKRTRAQMEDDLQLFLGDNTELFVNWLHQVLKKLQEVTVTGPLKTDIEKSAEKSAAKEKKKRDKDKTKKTESAKKAKKKEKEKDRKKAEKKSTKSKKKGKHEIIRPNIPPLLMNMEKESEPSITDVFAGQILKNHGVLLEPFKDEDKVFKEIKHPIVPITDFETIMSTPEPIILETRQNAADFNKNDGPRDQQVRVMHQIEEKIQGLKQKLAEQLDSMSDDEDFLNIRTEAEELMNDFAEDVCQEISQSTPATPPLSTLKTEPLINPIPTKEPELPQIELNLPKRPIRERLGAKEVPRIEVKEKEKEKIDSPERFTPDLEIETRPKPASSRSLLNSQFEPQRKSSLSDDNSEKPESSNKRLISKISVLESRKNRATCASVVLVRPRPRGSAPASNLLLRAVAEAHKSLLNTPKIDTESPKVKRALVLPMRRVETQKIVIEVPVDTHSDSQEGDTLSLGDESEGEDKNPKISSDITKMEFIPTPITKVINNTEYVCKINDQDDMAVDNNIIHNTTVDKEKTQFIVTMDGYHPNVFLAKKLKTEGLLDEEVKETAKEVKEKPKEIKEKPEEINKNGTQKENETKDTEKYNEKNTTLNKRLSDASEESDTQVIIKEHKEIEKRKTAGIIINKEVPPVKKRRASPIVFDVLKKEKEQIKEKEDRRERTISTSSDSVTLNTSSHKYDSLPPLAQSSVDKKQVWCRSFPLCRYGAACAFAHPRCKFAAACTRRGCVYSHPPGSTNMPSPPVLASHVVPAANYKSVSSAALPSMCKYYPNCVNPACHFYHPKPCRFGKACVNKLECNFYHHDFPTKWKYAI